MEELRSILLGTAALIVAGGVALVLTLARGGVGADEGRIRAGVRAAAAAVVLQAAHFAEELATGFNERFPTLLGLDPWPLGFFVSFNLVWLAIWLLCIAGLKRRSWAALFPLWFLGIAGIANGVGHPAFAVRTGSYFPGLVTSPFVAIAGVLLVQRLVAITERRV
jgi:hypothetical protein